MELEEEKRVISDLEQGLYLWTNEGKQLKAWVGDSGSQKNHELDVETVISLFNKGEIRLAQGDYPDNLFKYELTVK